MVGQETTDHAQGHSLLGQDPLDRAVVRASTEPHVADGGDLVGAHRRVLGLEVHDKAAHRWRQGASLRALRGEKGVHAFRPDPGDPAVQGPPRGACLFRPPRDGQAEQNQRPDLLVSALLRPPAKKPQLLPVIGRLDAPSAFAFAHLCPLQNNCMLRREVRTMPHPVVRSHLRAALRGPHGQDCTVTAIRVTDMCSVGRGEVWSPASRLEGMACRRTNRGKRRSAKNPPGPPEANAALPSSASVSPNRP